MRFTRSLPAACAIVGCCAANLAAQTPLSWADVRTRFVANNPTLRAAQFDVDESRADEVTAYLRPNPDLSLGGIHVNLAGVPEGAGRFQNLTTGFSLGYQIERARKRQLRRDSAAGATAIAVSTQADLVRTMTFTLRGAFVQLLQAKSLLTLAQAQLTDYDQVLSVSRVRLQSGDIAQIDLDRLQLQRVQYESDIQSALVNVRTTKIQLLGLLNDRTTPVEQFDVTGPYDFAPMAQPVEQFRQIARQGRPDLRAALQGIDKARTDYRLAIANGSTDPGIGATYGYQTQPDAPTNHFVEASVGFPLRIFDRNQGEKERTRLDITRNERLADANTTQVFADVDSAYATVLSSVALLQPYKDTYLDQSLRVRDTVTFSYQNGGASLVDFLQTQQDYRSVQITYVNLVASYLNAVNQLNLAVGQEVIP
jgi:cobalt-zinc-cadmium efflux system outer membrane protein